ncbi:MAG: efflux RND transporter permease subunit [Planctomycetes bacterium]|nr:efflux RND transporter permease subunit [Planctomycetota bacterium]MCW8134793.1 efflux RND transporter permease subunit [Planctomycetota bacterium]
MTLTELCVKKPVLAWMIMGATIVFGLVASQKIGISQFPDVDFPTVTVSVTWEGASPEAVERDVVEPLEQALSQVEGIRTISSTSRQGRGQVTLEFDISRDIDSAMQDVQNVAGEAQRNMPRDAEPPSVRKTNPEDRPIMYVALSGPYSRQELADTTRYRVRERLQTVPGVGEVSLGGYLDRNVRIWINADKLDAKNLTVSDLISALRREHVELPAGRIETTGREVTVRVLGEALQLEELRNIVVREIDGRPTYLHEVALVEDGFEDERRKSRFNGEPAQGMGIRKQRGANAVQVAKDVRATMDEIRPTLPEGMELRVNFDSTVYIEESVQEIEFELIVAILLTAFVCWMFLGSLSSTLNVILAIPMSLLGTVAIIYFLGFTLNTFTLLALALAVGIVVDDAIMIMENIYRHSEEGADRIKAAIGGTKQIMGAALAATIAICAIFIPVVFMEGVTGKFFFQFGVTLSLCVLLSYVEAITLAPARCAQLLKRSVRENRGAVGTAVDKGFNTLKRAYAAALKPALRRPWVALVVASAVFAGALWLMLNLPSEFVPSQDQSRLMVRLQTAVGSTLEESDELFTKAEKYVNDHPHVERVFLIVGGFGGGEVNTGVMFVTLVPPNKRDKTQADLMAEFRREMNKTPGLRANVQDLSQQGFSARRGYPVEFSIRGPDFEKLGELSQQLMQEMAASGLAVDVDSDYQIGQPELRIVPDRARCADLGVPMEDVAVTLNALVGGVRVGKFSSEGRRLDVRMRLLAEQRKSPQDIDRLRVRTKTGERIPLSSLVKQEEVPVLQSIIRQDRERSITISANVAPGATQNEALAKARELQSKLPDGYRIVMSGSGAEYQQSFNSLLFALLMGILVAYMVLAGQFNSFFHPLTILTIVPLSIAGAALALWLGGQTLNIFSMIGLLLLLGIAKKNSIILVDYANQLRLKGLTARQAMQEAGPIRLRPIMMTSIATMMAAVPAAIALGPGGEIRRPMALGVIGGMFVATMLSLLVVPSFYVLMDDFLALFKGKGHKEGESTHIGEPDEIGTPGDTPQA